MMLTEQPGSESNVADERERDAMATGQETATKWHVMTLAELFQAVNGKEAGRTTAEAQAQLERFGPNKRPSQPPPAWWQILCRQFQSPLIYILVAATEVMRRAGT
jgi:Ca2+-transporting ATPase